MRLDCLCIVSLLIPFILTAQDEGPVLVLPPVIHLTDGLETRIYYDNVVSFAEPYTVVLDSEIGEAGEAYWSYLPKETQSSLYRLSMTVLDESGSPVASAESVLLVTPQSGSSDPLRLLIIGDSLTSVGVYQRRLVELLDAVNIQYETIGTVRSDEFNFEAYRGNTYNRFLEGPYYLFSPFVYRDTGFDPKRYFAENTDGVLPDLFIIFLGINDVFSGSRGTADHKAALVETVIENAVVFVDGLREAAPMADVAILLTPAGSSEQIAYESAYEGADLTVEGWQDMRLRLIKAYIEDFSNREQDGIYLVSTSVGIDRLADYSLNDPIHPQVSGYENIGESLFAWLNYYVQDQSYGHWVLDKLPFDKILEGQGDFSADPDGDGYGNEFEYIFAMDPGAVSETPLLLDVTGLGFSYRVGYSPRLENLTDSGQWKRWSGLSTIRRSEGMMHYKVPISYLFSEDGKARFWRLVN